MNTLATAPSASIDPVLMTMDVVDTLRREQKNLGSVLGQAQEDETLVARVRQTYADQGIEVSEKLIQEAVEALKERRFAYTAPPASFSTSLARLYTTRAKWGRSVRYFSMVTAFFGAAAAGTVGLVSNIAENRLENRHIAIVAQVATETAFAKDIEGQLRTPVGPTSAVEQARASFQLAQRNLAAVDIGATNPASVSDTHVLNERLGESERLLKAVHVDLTAAKEKLSLASNLDSLRKQALALRQPREGVDGVLAQAVAQQVTAALTAVEAGQVPVAQRALTQANQFLQISGPLRAARQEIASWPTDAQAEAAGALEGAQAGIATGNSDAVASSLARIQTLRGDLLAAYTLTISDRPNVKSGVRRKNNDIANSHSYYIVVDAIGPDGQPIKLPIVSVEDGQTKTTSHFAVRVPEAVYEQVKSDKMDNGLVDKRSFAVKKSGILKPVYEFAVSGGAITTW